VLDDLGISNCSPSNGDLGVRLGHMEFVVARVARSVV
jgi:hypothetical protein